jgi:hypothetical protein
MSLQRVPVAPGLWEQEAGRFGNAHDAGGDDRDCAYATSFGTFARRHEGDGSAGIHGNSMAPGACFERCTRFEEVFDVTVVGFSWPSDTRYVAFSHRTVGAHEYFNAEQRETLDADLLAVLKRFFRSADDIPGGQDPCDIYRGCCDAGPLICDVC